MKSSAFNLAFKVHRNEIPFAEGILKANSEGAAEDFLDALNSLAGEVRYDPAQLPDLLAQAQGASGGAAVPPLQEMKPGVDLSALLEEVNNLHKKKRDLEEGITTLKSMAAQRHPLIVPGVNSVMLLIVCAVVVMILFTFGQPIVGLVFILLGLGGAGMIYMKDLKVLQKQRAEAEKRRAKHEAEITRLQTMLEENEKLMATKEAELKAAQQAMAAARPDLSWAADGSPGAPRSDI
ncbi:MAG TPA: hypothetical protein PK395_00890 [bacterium]|nr:hypothetical protein [bacterium]HQP97674.1 hypothetical protein [bacterium]